MTSKDRSFKDNDPPKDPQEQASEASGTIQSNNWLIGEGIFAAGIKGGAIRHGLNDKTATEGSIISKSGLFKDNKAPKEIQADANETAYRIAITNYGGPNTTTPNDGPKRTSTVYGSCKVVQPGKQTAPVEFPFNATYSGEYTDLKAYKDDEAIRQAVAELIQKAFRHLVAPEAAQVPMEFMTGDGKPEMKTVSYIVTGRCTGNNIPVDFKWSVDGSELTEAVVNESMQRD